MEKVIPSIRKALEDPDCLKGRKCLGLGQEGGAQPVVTWANELRKVREEKNSAVLFGASLLGGDGPLY